MKSFSIEIILIDGQVKYVHSRVLFEIRNLDMGYPNFNKTEINQAIDDKRALLYIENNICLAAHIPENVEVVVNDEVVVENIL